MDERFPALAIRNLLRRSDELLSRSQAVVAQLDSRWRVIDDLLRRSGTNIRRTPKLSERRDPRWGPLSDERGFD